MSSYSERYERLIRPVIEEYNRKCDQLADKKYELLGIQERGFISQANPEYYGKLRKQFQETGSCRVDSNELKVFDPGMARLYEKQKAKKAAEE